jgi:ribosomal protein S18 acetylase RimI-like enzyme
MDNPEAQQFWSDLGFEETWRIVQYRKSLGRGETAEATPRPKRASPRPAKAKKTSKRAPKKARRRR